MKKIIVAIIIVILITIGIVFIKKSNKNIDEVLAQFEKHEIDGYYYNDEAWAGYVVSNRTEDGYRYGYVNYKGDVLLEAEFNEIYRVMDIKDKDNVYIIASKNGRYGVSRNGKTMINYEYQYIDYNNRVEGFLLQKSENYGVANIKGKVIIPVENELVEVKGTHIYVSNGETENVYDKDGKKAKIDFNTSFDYTENENYAIKILEKDEEYFYGVVDKNGKELIKPDYVYIEYLFDDYFIVSNKNNRDGILDASGNEILGFNFNIVQKIQNTNLIRTLNNETEETEIYSQNFEKICTMKNANIEKEGNIIKVYNETEEKYFDVNGIEINK